MEVSLVQSIDNLDPEKYTTTELSITPQDTRTDIRRYMHKAFTEFKYNEVVKNKLAYFYGNSDIDDVLLVAKVDRNTVDNIIRGTDLTLFQLAILDTMATYPIFKNWNMVDRDTDKKTITFSLNKKIFFLGLHDKSYIVSGKGNPVVVTITSASARKYSRLIINGSTNIHAIMSRIYQDMVGENDCPYLIFVHSISYLYAIFMLEIVIVKHDLARFSKTALRDCLNDKGILCEQYNLGNTGEQTEIILNPKADKEYNNEQEYEKELVKNLLSNPDYVLEHMVAKA